MTSRFGHPIFAPILAAACCLAWGSAYPAIKAGYILFHIEAGDLASKILFAGYRFVLAGVAVLVIARLMRRRIWSLRPRQWLAVGALGIVQTGLQYVFFYIGLAFTSGAKGSVVNSTGTFFSAILAHFLYRNDRLTPAKVVGCLIGFGGVLIVNWSPSLLFDYRWEGEGFVILAALTLAAASLWGRTLSQKIDTIVLTGWQLLVGGVALTLTGWASGGWIVGFTVENTLLLLYLAALSSVAFTFWALLLKHNQVTRITIFNFLIPVSGVMLSALFLGESIGEWKYLAALVAVSLGIALVTRPGRLGHR